ncbi:Na+/H+ antiporter NhaC [Psychromonas ossibalaenae]|uniref:Na+/H+ antiporter NhaC n=1 Tax=Psychromonas ossibalaenae TaxID=444922 RepID=UPI0003644248|nr:Na+/H+ antiporter NhaC [Psychromonas ossibalaenae]
MNSIKRSPSLSQALLPVVAMLGFFFVGGFAGLPLELLMMASAVVSCGLAVYLGYGWKEIQKAMGDKFAQALPAILILQVVGFMIGAWMISGTIPMMIKLGITLISPQFLFVSAFVVTSMVSVCTGTSWGSASTIGVALMGVAAAQDISLPITAGAVISGAYFGDKMSPLSDSCNITAVAAKADIFKHIKNMTYTSVPSAMIAIVVFTFLGFSSGAATDEVSAQTASLLADMESIFNLNFSLLLPVLFILVGSYFQKPAVLLMMGASVIASIQALIIQDFTIQQVMDSVLHGFNVSMIHSAGVDPESISDASVKLLNRGGLYSLINAVIIILCAFTIAAGLEVSGSLKKIMRTMVAKVETVFGLISATMVSGAVLVSSTSHGGVSALIVGDMFGKVFDDQKLAPVNLSRTMEDSIIITEPLMPWTVSGIFMSATLGVSVLEYAPWALFCVTGVFFSLMWAKLHDMGVCKLRAHDVEELVALKAHSNKGESLVTA